MVSDDFFLISWRDLLYSWQRIKRDVLEKRMQKLLSKLVLSCISNNNSNRNNINFQEPKLPRGQRNTDYYIWFQMYPLPFKHCCIQRYSFRTKGCGSKCLSKITCLLRKHILTGKYPVYIDKVLSSTKIKSIDRLLHMNIQFGLGQIFMVSGFSLIIVWVVWSMEWGKDNMYLAQCYPNNTGFVFFKAFVKNDQCTEQEASRLRQNPQNMLSLKV